MLSERLCLDAEENLPAEEETPSQGARLQNPDENEGGPQRSQEADVQGQAQALRLNLASPDSGGAAARSRWTDSMRRANRLRKSSDFALARRRGRSWADHRLVLVARPNDSDATRFGFSVSKRIGNAVKRNKMKRRLKSAAIQTPVQSGLDMVVIARQGAREADYYELRRSLRRLLRRAGALARREDATDPQEPRKRGAA